jgi:hypothetical protein
VVSRQSPIAKVMLSNKGPFHHAAISPARLNFGSVRKSQGVTGKCPRQSRILAALQIAPTYATAHRHMLPRTDICYRAPTYVTAHPHMLPLTDICHRAPTYATAQKTHPEMCIPPRCRNIYRRLFSGTI